MLSGICILRSNLLHSIIVAVKNAFLKQSCLVLITGTFLPCLALQDLIASRIILETFPSKFRKKSRVFCTVFSFQGSVNIISDIFSLQRSPFKNQLWLILHYIELIQSYFGKSCYKHVHIECHCNQDEVKQIICTLNNVSE